MQMLLLKFDFGTYQVNEQNVERKESRLWKTIKKYILERR